MIGNVNSGQMKSKEIIELSDFLHKAFCVDGETKFIKIVYTPGTNLLGAMFEITDKKRGIFYITIQKPE